MAELSSANNYYFSSSSGDDNRDNEQAQHPVTPWKTIEKLNSISPLLKPGDSILFKRGEKFFGSIQIKISGSVSSPIVFSTYGNGSRPEISGLDLLGSWALFSKGIYRAKCASCKTMSENMLIINGVQQIMGRYPNEGYLNYQSHTGNTSITDKNLKNTPDWTGAELVIRKNHWIIDRSTISRQSGTRLNYTGGSSSEPTDGFGYFIQNDLKTLDRFGEWYFDPSTENMLVFFGDASPRSYQVYTSGKNILVDMKDCRAIKLENLSFTGASQSAIHIKNSKNISIINCLIDLSATDGVNASGSVDIKMENSTVNHSLNDAIVLDSSCRSAILRHNAIKNTGTIAGMGKSGTGTYQSLSAFGASTTIEYNDIDSSGYNAIYFGGNSTTVKNNFIRNFCFVKDDGAAIYVGDWFPSTGKKIVGNIILHGIGAPEGSVVQDLIPVEGIYIDDNTTSVDILSNAVSDCTNAGIKIHNAKDIRIYDNTVFDNGIQLLLAHDNLHPNSPVRNVSCKKNIFFSRTAAQQCLYLYSVKDDLDEVGSMDSNFYYRPASDQAVIKTVSNIWTAKSVTNNFPLDQWKEKYKQDPHSKKSLSKIIGEKNISFEYNATTKNKEIKIKGSYVNAEGIITSNKKLLTPYRSVIVIKDQQ